MDHDLLAGSAIGQSVGRLKEFARWNPLTPWLEPRWLLISGASDPPRNINVSERRTRGDRNGEFLRGASKDLVNMEEAVGTKLHNTVKDLYMAKSAAIGHIKIFMDYCYDNNYNPVIYYTGHGEIGTGDWCFADGTISIQEIVRMKQSKGNEF